MPAIAKSPAQKKLRQDASRALGSAAAFGDVEQVRELLKNGVAATKDAILAAMRAAEEIRAESSHSSSQVKALIRIVKLLLRAGLDPNGIEARWGHSVLGVAVQSGIKEMVSAVIEAGADLDAISSGRTPLILAVCNDRPKLVALLLKSGARADAQDIYGCTALIEAITRTKTRMAATIADSGVSLDPSEFLLRHRAEIVKLLLDAGANPRLKWKGETLLQIAKEDGDAGVVAMLENALNKRKEAR